MEKGNLAHEQPSSTGWGTLFFVYTEEDVSATAVTPPSPSARPSVVFSSKGDSGSPLKKLQMVGLHPSCDIQGLKRQYFGRRPHGPGRLRSALSGQHHFRVEPNLEPQGSPSEDRNFRIRSDVDSADTEEAPFSGQEEVRQLSSTLWSTCIIWNFIYQMTILHMAGSTVDLMSCSLSFELAEAHRAFALEEVATALSVWAISCLCGSLRLDHVLTIFAFALLEKQIMFSFTHDTTAVADGGILSASVLSIISLIRPARTMSSPDHPISNLEDVFSSNFPNYVPPASPDYVPTSQGKTYSSASNSFGIVSLISPTLSLFPDDPYMKADICLIVHLITRDFAK
ncbi:hypothetical protein Tco_1160215 [Tanacetum coccineum]